METKAISSPSSVVENEAFWKRHAESHKASGLSRMDYCRINQVNYDRFGYWLSKWSRQTKSLVAVKLTIPTKSLDCTLLCKLSLRNGSELAIHDMQALSFILEKLS